MVWKSPSGDKAAVLTLVFLLFVSALAHVGLSTIRDGASPENAKEDKASRHQCETYLRSLGYSVPASDGQAKDAEEIKKYYDLCQQIRSVQAAEDAAYYGRRQWLVATAGLVFVIIATVLAGRAYGEAKRQADAATEGLVHARISAQASLFAAQTAAKEAKLRYKPWIMVDLLGPFAIPPSIDKAGPPLRRFAPDELERHVRLHAKVVIEVLSDIPAVIEDIQLTIGKGLSNGKLGGALGTYPEGFGERVVIKGGDKATIDPTKHFLMPSMPDDAMRAQYQRESPGSFATLVLSSAEEYEALMRGPPSVDGFVIYSDPLGNRYKHMFSFIPFPVWGNDYKRFGGRNANREEEMT